MFRKLYWVLEQIDAQGRSRVNGVYTSIPDLIHHGLAPLSPLARIRLTLTKLDSENGPLGTWESPSYAGLREGLAEFIRTDEFSADQCEQLLQTLHVQIGVAV
jgi:hypothetical protein